MITETQVTKLRRFFFIKSESKDEQTFLRSVFDSKNKIGMKLSICTAEGFSELMLSQKIK